MTFSYEEICKRIGYDPLKDPYPIPFNGHEDDSYESPFVPLSREEKDFLADYIIQHRYNKKN